MKKVMLSIIVLLLIPAVVFGFSKSGQQAMQFLEIGMGARATAMGCAYVASADDAISLYWNPAGIAELHEKEKKFSFTATHLKYFADINYDFIGAIYDVKNIGVFGISASMLYMPEMDRRTVFHSEGDGTKFKATDMMVGLSYARHLTDKFAVGLTFKYVAEYLDDVSGQSWTADLGTTYKVGFKDIRIGMAIKDFGANVNYLDKEEFSDAYSAAMPITFRLGIMKEWNLPKESLRDKTPHNDFEVLTALELLHPADSHEQYMLGTEFRFKNMFFVRGGYCLTSSTYDDEDEKKEDEQGSTSEFGDSSGSRNTDYDFSAGFGLMFDMSGKMVKVDYSFTHFKYLAPELMDNPHRISIGFEF
ncbi:MAG: PorV/PorQ family protein [Candidatus Coatesbacteria bacterium]|nr:PorV/PorQ family protein [Candidatus Coatesbacteria bacterium]